MQLPIERREREREREKRSSCRYFVHVELRFFHVEATLSGHFLNDGRSKASSIVQETFSLTVKREREREIVIKRN